MLLVPRNEGACLWAPSIPFSTTPACTVNTTSSAFSCHLHTNGAFTLERSKSDVQTNKHFRAEFSLKTTFYTDEVTQSTAVKESSHHSNHVFVLGRSKTSALLPDASLVNNSIFDNRPAFSRAAPSPPVRNKLSPHVRRADDVKHFTVQGKMLGTTGILDEAPIPPRRKTSPKLLEFYDAETGDDSKNSTEDLIQF